MLAERYLSCCAGADTCALSHNGVETRRTWDQALEIPVVISTTDGDLLLYGLDLLGLEHNGAWYYPQTDALGSLRQWTDAAGAVVGSASYDPFGGELSRQGFTSPWGFAGEYHDPTTGLQYLRARWYQPGVGRFTQGDPCPSQTALGHSSPTIATRSRFRPRSCAAGSVTRFKGFCWRGKIVVARFSALQTALKRLATNLTPNVERGLPARQEFLDQRDGLSHQRLADDREELAVGGQLLPFRRS